MAKRLRRAGDRKLIAAIDAGASKAACVIARLEPVGDGRTEAEIVGVGQYGAPRRPVRGGAAGAAQTDDHDETETAMRAAIECAERMAGARAEAAFVAVSGRSLRSRRVGVEIETVGGCVTAEDVADCLKAGCDAAAGTGAGGDAALEAGVMALHAEPMRFLVDGEPCRGAPEGLAGDVLGAELLALTVRESVAANWEASLNRCGLELEAVVAAPYVAADAMLVPDEKELGVVFLDVGARSTNVAVFERGAVVGCGAVKLGGEHVTRDVAQIFGAPLADAERIKTLYGGVMSSAGDEHRLIDFPQLGDPSEVARHPRAELCAVVAPRFDEILEHAGVLADRLIGPGRSLRRAVLTGGASLTLGAREAAERTLGVKARLGRPARLAGAPEAASAPQFAVAIGVVQYAAKRRRGGAPSTPAVAAAAHAPAAWFGGVGAWLRQNF
ncbi:MAG: cell division protein FtsA [Parvularculaceae bacterium]